MFGGYLRPFHIESYLSRHSGGGGGGAAPAPQENRLSNDDLNSWFKPGSALNPSTEKGPIDGKPVYAFVANNPTTSQLIFMGKNNFPDHGYFNIWAKGTGNFVMMVQRRAGGWNIYGQKNHTLTSSWIQYTIEYTASGYDPNDIVGFKLDTRGAANAPTDMLISAPSITDSAPEPPRPQAPATPIGDGTVRDRWMAWLKSQGATGYHLHELEISWLQKLGHTGTFADMVIQKWQTKDALRDWFLKN